MAIRFDVGEIKSPFLNHDGALIAEGTFARDGILTYHMPDGKTVREFRPPEENKKALTQFGLVPVTIEHPPVLVTEDNAETYRKGVSLQNVAYGKGGFVRGEVYVMDSEAIDYIRKGGAEISAGYTCDIDDTPGVWNGQTYDRVQRNIKVNHLALTRRGRAGPDVRVHLDSLPDRDVGIQISPSTPKPRMATLRIDSIDYEVPEVIAPLIGQKLRRLDELEDENGKLADEVDDLEKKLDAATQEADRHRGRADAQDICLTNAEIILEDLGYRRDAGGDYIRVDMGKKKPMDMEMDEEMDDEEDAEEEMPMKGKKKDGWMGGKKKMDGSCGDKKMDSLEESTEVRVDAKELALAWKEAEQLTGESIEAHFDSLETPADVRRFVVGKLRPSLAEKLDSYSDAAIDGIYDLLKEDGGDSRQDAASSPAELMAAIGAARSKDNRNPVQAGASTISQNYLQPLSLSR